MLVTFLLSGLRPLHLLLMAPGLALMLYLAANRRVVWWLPLALMFPAWWVGGKGAVTLRALRKGAKAGWRAFTRGGRPFDFEDAALAVTVLGVALFLYCHLRARLSDATESR